MDDSATIATEPPILDVRAVSADYGSSGRRRRPASDPDHGFALRDISFTIPRGESVGLVGESGSGKTTLGNCIAGLLRVSSGEIRYNNRLVSSPEHKPRLPRVHGVQVVYQDPFSALNPRRSVGSILREILLVHKMCDRKQASERSKTLLRQVGLDSRVLKSRPRALSGGMCQRVAIARALAFEPELLIADEVVSALDASVQAQVLNLLADLRETMGLSLLFISHDLAVVNQLCGRVAVMHGGRIVEIGMTSEVLRSPKDQYTRELLRAIPQIISRDTTIPQKGILSRGSTLE